MTTIVLVRKNNEVVVAGDGQVSMGNTVVKSTASKVRKIEKRSQKISLFSRVQKKINHTIRSDQRPPRRRSTRWRVDSF